MPDATTIDTWEANPPSPNVRRPDETQTGKKEALNMDKPTMVLVGLMTHSFATYDDGVRERYGAGVSYGGQAAAALGIPATIVTVGAEDLEPGLDKLRSAGLQVIRVPRPESQNHSNDYRNGQRKIQAKSLIDRPIDPTELEHIEHIEQIVHSDIALFFPSLNEITPETLAAFKTKLVFLDAGGLTRHAGEKNEQGLYPLNQGDWENIDGFRNKVGILKLSHEDLEKITFPQGVTTDEQKVQSLAENGFPVVVLTRGERPTLLVRKALPLKEVPVYKLEGEGDSAGAGEVFSVGFMYEYFLTGDAVKATAFGNACASFKMMGDEYNYEKAKERAEEILANTPFS